MGILLIGIVQKTLNKMGYSLKVDGIMGPNTLNAINSADSKELFNNFKDARIQFCENLVARRPDQKKFFKGWMNRINSFVYDGTEG